MRPRIISPADVQAWARHLLSQGRTTKALGLELGVSQPTVSRLATGKTAMLRPEATLRLLELAGGKVQLPPVVVDGCDAAAQ